jgi:hypothetical protein
MDDNVIAAVARWPNVPSVYGWLSLNERGQWRLHPDGNALADTHTSTPYARQGTSIGSPQIIQFMNRNYGHDGAGRWFFQNGPQRVYVRLDAAAFVLHSGNPCNGQPTLHAHIGQQIDRVTSWWLTDAGRLYAVADLGPALVVGRDLDVVLNTLVSQDGRKVLDRLDGFGPDSPPFSVSGAACQDALLSYCPEATLPMQLGFVRLPQPEQ